MSNHRVLQQAFTLIELVTVIALLGITMAVITPRFVDMTTFRARGYADEVAGALRYGQRIAMASSCNVQFTVTATSYSAVQRASKTNCTLHGSWSREVLLPDGNQLTGTAPADVTASAVVLEFDATGTPVSAVTPIAVGGFAVAIDSVTGRVTVQ
jgi:MSHA pilin protein MshC